MIYKYQFNKNRRLISNEKDQSGLSLLNIIENLIFSVSRNVKSQSITSNIKI